MDKLKFFITVTNNTLTDQRMQRIAASLRNVGFRVVFIGHMRPPFIQSDQNTNELILLKTLFQKGPLFYSEFNARVFIKLILNKFDVVYAVDLDTILAARYASFFKKKKIIFDAHEYYTETPELINRGFTKTVWKFIKRISMWNIDLALTVNKMLADILTNEDKISYQVIRNLPYYNLKTPDLTYPKKILIYQGAINKGRAIEIYIEVMDLLPDFELWIIGSGDLNDEITNLIEISKSKNRICFYGHMSPEELQLKTTQAGIGLNLLDGESKSYYYSLANKFFDYIQAGIPSINMDFPVYKDYLEEYKVGEHISSGDPKILANIIKYMSEPNQYLTYQKYISEAARELNWENEEKKLIHLIKEIL